ncbi:ABC transporter ATP-binding protein [Tepidiphilus margaritifer]|uniref:ABC transporter ATP-binding protein n=1 Tax=Tepidiphilus margaritifer TaxID=203471 RepID=UPI00040941CF|nr:ABC transporter ATP-binding protein [Tepidiphilus margaritifer]
MTAAIALQGAVKRFGDFTALAGVDLTVERGEFFGLLGPNGAGKTTLISLLAGLARPSAGSVRVMGFDVVRDYRQARRAIGVVPQELVFDPFFTVREILRIQSGYFGLTRNEDWIEELLHGLGLADKAEANMRTLSGGMKRRVLVAQALVHRPPVIVLDEPTAGVDVELRHGLWQFIQKLNEQGHTILLTTHYLEEAESLCHRIAMLKAGRIVALDTTERLLARFQAHELEVRLDRPEAALALGGVAGEDGWVRIPFEHYADIEGLLRRLREGGAEVRELRVGEPDLERVFVEVMRSA